ncbi:MAG: hypothetical protein K6C33_05995 [Desulfovibrio sp.]|nr:hypothetical protein [Desulfovibrio sp.]
MTTGIPLLDTAAGIFVKECRAGRCPLLGGEAPSSRPGNCPFGDAPCGDASLEVWIEAFHRHAQEEAGKAAARHA